MKDFVQFISRIVLFSLLLTAVLWLVFFIILPPDYNDVFAILYRKNDYLQNAAGSKVVLLGGSNVLYGIDSELLEERFQRPVVNLSLQVGIPLTMDLMRLNHIWVLAIWW